MAAHGACPEARVHMVPAARAVLYISPSHFSLPSPFSPSFVSSVVSVRRRSLVLSAHRRGRESIRCSAQPPSPRGHSIITAPDLSPSNFKPRTRLLFLHGQPPQALGPPPPQARRRLRRGHRSSRPWRAPSPRCCMLSPPSPSDF